MLANDPGGKTARRAEVRQHSASHSVFRTFDFQTFCNVNQSSTGLTFSVIGILALTFNEQLQFVL